MIITVDGADGVGKTTLATKLCEELNFKLVNKPFYRLLQIDSADTKMIDTARLVQHIVYDETKSDKVKAWFNGMALLYLKETIQENAVIDRGFLSCCLFNGNEETFPIFESLIDLGVGFDLSILLYCSPEERRNRLVKRNPNDPDLMNKQTMSLVYDAAEHFLNHKKFNVLYIDTTNKDAEKVFEEALAYIKKMPEFKHIAK